MPRKRLLVHSRTVDRVGTGHTAKEEHEARKEINKITRDSGLNFLPMMLPRHLALCAMVKTLSIKTVKGAKVCKNSTIYQLENMRVSGM